jgi:hypothetical protein
MSPCPPELDAFFARAFAGDPARRFANAAEMTAAIAALAPGSGVVQAGSAAALGPTTLASSVSQLAASVATPKSAVPVVYAPPAGGIPSTTLRSEYNPLLEAHPAAPSSPDAPAARARKKLPAAAWIGIGLGGLVVASGALALVIGAVSRDPSPPPQPSHHAAPVASHPHPASESEDALCERACEELERCTNVTGSNCRAECARNAEYRACVRPLHRADCKGAALCALAVGCPGRAPQGRATCKQAAECEFSCEQHKAGAAATACGCACVHELSADKAIELAANNLCGVTYCQTDCKPPANPVICGACMVQHCKAPNQACLSH